MSRLTALGRKDLALGIPSLPGLTGDQTKGEVTVRFQFPVSSPLCVECLFSSHLGFTAASRAYHLAPCQLTRLQSTRVGAGLDFCQASTVGSNYSGDLCPPTIYQGFVLQNCPFCRKYNLSDCHQESLRRTRRAFTPDTRIWTREPLSKKAANGSYSMTEKVLNEHLGFRIRYADKLITIFKMQNNLQ